MDNIEELAKRRGFFWNSSELYGGLSGFYDYGHLGKLIKNRWEQSWRNFFLDEDMFYEIEAATIVPEEVLVASGHVSSFVDPIIKCSRCGHSDRADHLLEEELKESFEGATPEHMAEILKKHNIRCKKCNGKFEETGIMNMMFALTIGTGKETKKAYLLPETAQGVYLNFNRCFEHLRKQLPLGLAIIGKAYRNEISPRNALIRMREFRQAELQIFFDPEKIHKHDKFHEIKNYKLLLLPEKQKTVKEISCEDAVHELKLPQFYVYYMAKMQRFFLDVMKTEPGKFRFRELSAEERAFYNKFHWDIELNLSSIGWKEIAGCHYRTDHDLGGHQKHSKTNLAIHVDGKTFVPHVLELSFGIDRSIYALLDMCLRNDAKRTYFAFPPYLSPYDVAIFPLVNKDGMDAKAKDIYNNLKRIFTVFYDESGTVGRRYARVDEIGVPLAMTIDSQTMKDNTVTLRERDSTKQIRVQIADLQEKIKEMTSML